MELRDLHPPHEFAFRYRAYRRLRPGNLAVTEEAVEFAISVCLLQTRVQIIRATVSQNHEPDPEQ
jgi:hypothetical protein